MKIPSQQLQDIVHEVAPLVAQTMELPLDIDDLVVRPVKPSRRWSEVELPALESQNRSWIPMDFESHIRYVMHRYVAHTPNSAEVRFETKTLAVYPRNFLANNDWISSLIAHELAHVAQYCIQDFRERRLELQDRFCGKHWFKREPVTPENAWIVRQLLAVSTLMEGDASWTENRITEREGWFPIAAPSPGGIFRKTLSRIYRIRSRDVRAVFDDRYASGREFISATLAEGGRSSVRSLYDLPFLELYDRLGLRIPSLDSA